MSFFTSLPTSTRIQVLESSRNQLATELINVLLRYGVDPEPFDVSDIASLEGIVVGPDMVRLEQVCQGLLVIQTKLTALGV